MLQLTDLFNTQFGANQTGQIVDSYDLIKGIIDDFEGQANFNIKIDNTLPLIYGDPQELKLIFKDFIRQAFELFKGITREIHIIQIKNPKSWIFAFFLKGPQLEGQLNSQTNLVDTTSEFNLVISKKSIYNPEDLIMCL